MSEGQRILVVEDDSDLRDLVVQFLAEEGFEAKGVGTGAEAVGEIRARIPDLIVIDVLLPDFSGLVITEELRNESGLTSLPVYFISGKTDTETRLQCFISGGTRFIPKPFELDFLLESIRSELQTHAA